MASSAVACYHQLCHVFHASSMHDSFHKMDLRVLSFRIYPFGDKEHFLTMIPLMLLEWDISDSILINRLGIISRAGSDKLAHYECWFLSLSLLLCPASPNSHPWMHGAKYSVSGGPSCGSWRCSNFF